MFPNPRLAEALDGLTEAEALWLPAKESWTVRENEAGLWIPDWIEPEPPSLPPTSIAWIQRHVIWWWSTVIDRSFGEGTLERHNVTWPGSSQAMTIINDLKTAWFERLEELTDAELSSSELTKWPYPDRPFAIVADWVSIEFMKNVAEMCLLRHSSPSMRVADS